MVTGSFFALIFHWGVVETDHSPGMLTGYTANLYSCKTFLTNSLGKRLGRIHTTQEKCENAALFLRLGLPSTLIVARTELFENSLQTGGI